MINKDINAILVKGGQLLVEKGTYLVPKKKEERKELNSRLRVLIEEKGFKEVEMEDRKSVV